MIPLAPPRCQVIVHSAGQAVRIDVGHGFEPTRLLARIDPVRRWG
jgi:hypothetical protein